MLTRATIVVTACLSLLLGGCYETDKPIITRDIAVELPGLEGDILLLEDDTLDFSFDEQSMSYQAGERQTDGSIEWMPCAIMPLRDDLYWFQFRPEIRQDGQQTFTLFLFKFDRSLKQLKYQMPDMTGDESLRFAEQYRVTRHGEGRISGSRDDILAFLKANANVPLEEIGSE